MPIAPKNPFTRVKLISCLTGGPALALLPAVVLTAYWIGGEAALVLAVILIPMAIILLRGDSQITGAFDHAQRVQSAPPRQRIIHALDQSLIQQKDYSENSAAFVIELDQFSDLIDRYGQDAVQRLLNGVVDRIRGVLRENDLAVCLSNSQIAISVAPMRHFDLETAIQMSGRMQTALEEPMSLNAGRVYVSVSIGFCLSSRSPQPLGSALLSAATDAMIEARRNGPSAIRAYTHDMVRSVNARKELLQNLEIAMEQGQIRAWFQPQVSTDTGEISGFESLARWVHPSNGIIPPIEFLDAVEEAGLMERLGELILFDALSALSSWDDMGLNIPSIGVNFSHYELRNPKLVDKIKWDLDRFKIAPHRLSIEILESVVAVSDDDIITRNVTMLSELGCRIDLDDFGTGHASITNIRRLAVNRIKIDRSFVMKVDKDPEQQKLVSAILMMGDQLGLDTLAEGVETDSEHTMLAQLGCAHIQGYGIGRPMPFDDTLDWIRSYQSTVHKLPPIGKHAS